MGNICNSNTDELPEDLNAILRLKISGITTQVIISNYKTIKTECLVLITQASQLNSNGVIKEAVHNQKEVITGIASSKKILQIAEPARMIEAKKVIICALPAYESTNLCQYSVGFLRVLDDIFCEGSQFMFWFSQSGCLYGVPNQLIIGLVVNHLSSCKVEKVRRVKLVSQDRNICWLMRLQIMKGRVMKGESYQFERVRIDQIEPSMSVQY